MLFKQKDCDGWIKAQTTVCILLIVVMFASSFIPLYTVDVKIPDNVKSAVTTIESVLNDPTISDGNEIKVEFPEKLNVNIFLFFRAGTKVNSVINLYARIQQLADNAGQNTSNSYNQALRNLKQTASAARDLVTDSSFSNILALGATFYSAFTQSKAMMFIMVFMVMLTLIFPIALFITLMKALFGLIIHRRNVEARYLSTMRTFKRAVRTYILIIAMSLLGSGVNLSFGVILGLVSCVLGYLFSAFANRRKTHTPIGTKYLNTVQLLSIAQTGLFFAFFFCLLKTEVVTQYTSIIAKNAIPYIRAKVYGTEFLEQFMFMLTALLTTACLLAALSVLSGAMSRFGGMVGRNKDVNIISSSCTVVLVLLLVIITAKEPDISISGISLLFVFLSFLFAALIVSCEVLLICANKFKFKGNMKESERHAILTGLETVETEVYNEEDN